MTTLELFEEVFGENVFCGPRTQERTDKRCAIYLYMKKVMGVGPVDIGREIGRNHATIHSGIKRFEELLEIGDRSAVKTWGFINDRVNAILAHRNGEILTIDGEVEHIYTRDGLTALKRNKCVMQFPPFREDERK